MSSNITDYSHCLASTTTVAAQSIPDGVNYSYHILPPHPDLPLQGFNHENLNTSYEAQGLPARNCPSPQYRRTMGTAQVISENGLAAANHDMPFDPFMNNGQPSYYSDFNGVTHTNQALGNIQQFTSSANRLTTPASSETIEAERLQPDWGRQMIPRFWQSPSPSQAPRTYHNPANSSRRKRSILRCDGCGHTSHTRRDMERHHSTIQHGGWRKHKCRSCPKVYMRKDSLQRHVTRTGCGTHDCAKK